MGAYGKTDEGSVKVGLRGEIKGRLRRRHVLRLPCGNSGASGGRIFEKVKGLWECLVGFAAYRACWVSFEVSTGIRSGWADGLGQLVFAGGPCRR